MAGPGEDVEAREVGQVEERGWQTLALGPGRGEGEADPPWDFAGTSAAGEGRARGQVGLGVGEGRMGPCVGPGGGEGMADPGVGAWKRRGRSRPTMGLCWHLGSR